jgi:hypothetical protein
MNRRAIFVSGDQETCARESRKQCYALLMWRNTDNRLRSRWRFLVPIGVLPLPSREDYASRLHEKASRGGLLISHEGASTLLLLPALTIDRPVAQNGLDILEGCA